MSIFKNYISENIKSFKQYLEEKLITFGGKAYPRFNNAVILAGGAGSGKDFIFDKLLGIEGKTLDVDAVKKLALKTKAVIDKVQQETGEDISKFDLKNPENVSKLHLILSGLGITNQQEQALFTSVALADPNRKPNIIFNVTLKNITKLHNIATELSVLNYPKENTHLVWILNDIKIAIKQNKERDRVVPEDILIDTHKGVARTMYDLISNKSIQNYLDGDVFIVLNKVDVDNTLKKSKLDDPEDNPDFTFRKGSKGSYIKDATYYKIKEQGKPMITLEDFKEKLLNKIKEYTPKSKYWK